MNSTMFGKTSRPGEFFKEVNVKNVTKFTRKHLRLGLIFSEVVVYKPEILFKKRCRCFLMIFSTLFATVTLENTSTRLLLSGLQTVKVFKEIVGQ